MSKKEINYRCNVCAKGFTEFPEFIAHSREQHPDNPWALWDACGSLGVGFADAAMEILTKKLRERCDERDAAQAKVKQLEELIPQFNKMQHALNICNLAIALTREPK